MEFDHRFGGFYVDEGVEKYASFITEMRGCLQLKGEPDNQQQKKVQSCSVYLVSHTPVSIYVVLRIWMPRSFCLQLCAYKSGNLGGWFEFGSDADDPSKSRGYILKKSSFLNFEGDYASLERTCGLKMEDIPLGEQQLIDAVNKLGGSTRKDERAYALIVVIQMIIESLRDDYIFKLVSDPERYKNGLKPDVEMLTRERAHDDLLKTLEPAPTHPRCESLPPPPPCMPVLGGSQRAQVLAVHIKPRYSLKLYGTIRVPPDHHDPAYDEKYIYNRDSNHSEIIKAGAITELMLIGHCFISAEDSFFIDVNLKKDLRKRRKRRKRSNNRFINGVLYWNYFNNRDAVYDQVLRQEFSCKYGSVTLVYAVLSDAIDATVEVKLLDRVGGGDPSRTKVSGGVAARILKFSEYTRFLFKKCEGDECAEVSVGGCIPLSTSKVSVPADSVLEVEVALYDLCSKNVIASGVLNFHPPNRGTKFRRTGYEFDYYNCGKISVKVVWEW